MDRYLFLLSCFLRVIEILFASLSLLFEILTLLLMDLASRFPYFCLPRCWAEHQKNDGFHFRYLQESSWALFSRNEPDNYNFSFLNSFAKDKKPGHTFILSSYSSNTKHSSMQEALGYIFICSGPSCSKRKKVSIYSRPLRGFFLLFYFAVI